LAQQTILIHGEQGLADEIMLATCYPDIIQQAGRCVIVCEARLERLFRRSFPQAIVLGVPQGSEHQWRLPGQLSIDVQCPSGALPRFLRRSAEAFPRQQQLLTADPDRVAAWRKRWATVGQGIKIGVSWQAGADALNSARRSTPLAQWQPLLGAPGIHWINLQDGDYHDELAETVARQGVMIYDELETNRQYDLDNLAAMIAALDLVITVDNTTAHLSAALGIPTWIVLPEPADWRWLTRRNDSVWYNSVRLFRQDGLQQSGEVFRRMREELLKRRFRLDEKSIGPPSGHHWLGVHARGKR
jgi:hypothetical protein